MTIESTSPNTDTITLWCQEYLAELIEVPVAAIDPLASFDRLGVDSAHAVALLIEIEERYGVDIPPEALFDDPTVAAVTAYVLANLAAR